LSEFLRENLERSFGAITKTVQFSPGRTFEPKLVQYAVPFLRGAVTLKGGKDDRFTKNRIEMPVAHVFIYLQLLDLLTTLVGFKLGGAEASPFIRVLMHAGPAAGVLTSKVVALAIGGYCVAHGKTHLMKWATYWYAALVVWNLMVMLHATGAVPK
jgi:hypothetical protein